MYVVFVISLQSFSNRSYHLGSGFSQQLSFFLPVRRRPLPVSVVSPPFRQRSWELNFSNSKSLKRSLQRCAIKKVPFQRQVLHFHLWKTRTSIHLHIIQHVLNIGGLPKLPKYMNVFSQTTKSWKTWCMFILFLAAWWLNQPIWKICSSTWIMKPQTFGRWKSKQTWVATTYLVACIINHHPFICFQSPNHLQPPQPPIHL